LAGSQLNLDLDRLEVAQVVLPVLDELGPVEFGVADDAAAVQPTPVDEEVHRSGVDLADDGGKLVEED